MTKVFCDRVGCKTAEDEVASMVIPTGINGASVKTDFCKTCRTKILKFHEGFLKGTLDVQ